MIVRGIKGKHIIYLGDSREAEFSRDFDLVITSPPFYHPTGKKPMAGVSLPTRSLDEYCLFVARVLARAAKGMRRGGPICIIKTDVWYRRSLIPIGYKIIEACESEGMSATSHWIWQRRNFYSPYSPSFSNVFLLSCGKPNFKTQKSGLIATLSNTKTQPRGFAPAIFERLIADLTMRDSIVLDPFLGTGSVTLAAAQLGRWSAGVERSRAQLSVAKCMLSSIPKLAFKSL